MMHEIGLRILIRKIQLVGVQYEKALVPVFSYSKEHYMRVFLRSDKGKNKSDGILKQHGMFDNAGPMWLGKLWDIHLCNKIYNNSIKNKIFQKNNELVKFLKIIKDESRINSVGFYDLHDISEKYNIKELMKREEVINKIKKFGYKASETHFNGHSIRSDANLNVLIKIMKNE
jgi:tRNA (guanine26-N2/guanine27-N2)-dimethyltransferase